LSSDKGTPIRRPRRRGERAQSLVEFALIFPLFLVLVMGIIDFGWALRDYVTITNAAREGARLGVTLKPTDVNTPPAIRSRAKDYSSGLLPDNGDACGTSNNGACVEYPDGAQSTYPVKVTVIYNHNLITPIGGLLGWATGNTKIKLVSATTMRVE
jgi:Flp pilus assembly protein TadG